MVPPMTMPVAQNFFEFAANLKRFVAGCYHFLPVLRFRDTVSFAENTRVIALKQLILSRRGHKTTSSADLTVINNNDLL